MANTDYGAVLLTTCEATSQALNHRLGVSTGFKPSEWAENINLLVKPAEKSASGSVAHFTDGLDMPLVSLSCDITAWQEGTGTASPSNPRPIHGWSEANVYRTGKNMASLFSDGKVPSISTGALVNANGARTDYIKVLASTSYTFSVGNSQALYMFFYDGSKNFISYASQTGTVLTYTTPSSCAFIMLRTANKVDNVTTPMLEEGSTATTFSQYTGTSLNIPFGQTVYGGSLNVMTGELTIDKGYLQPTEIGSVGQSGGIYYWVLTNGLDSVNDTSTIISSHFKAGWQVAEGNCYITGNGKILVAVPSDQTLNTKELADAWCATNKPQFVYPLATPTTITLTPHQMSSLLGENNIWADCGDSAVVYRGMVGDSFKCFFNSQVTSGWTGTSVERTMLTVTGNGNGSITFDNNGKGRTNCSNSDGYISVRKNGTAVYTKSLAQNTDETLAIPAVNFSAGDVITLVFGFANYHSNINMKLTGDSFTVQGSATVSGISNTTNTSTTLEVST